MRIPLLEERALGAKSASSSWGRHDLGLGFGPVSGPHSLEPETGALNQANERPNDTTPADISARPGGLRFGRINIGRDINQRD